MIIHLKSAQMPMYRNPTIYRRGDLSSGVTKKTLHVYILCISYIYSIFVENTKSL